MTIEISQNESELDYQFQLTQKLIDLGYRCQQNCTIFVSHIQENKYEYYKNTSMNKQTRTRYIVDILATKWNCKFIVEMKKNIKNLKNIKSEKEMKKNLWKRGKDRWQIEKYKKIWIPVFLCYWISWFSDVLDFAQRKEKTDHKKYRLVKKWNVK